MYSKNSIISDNLSHIIFITGGTKSGKSEFAEHLAKKTNKISYVALSKNNISITNFIFRDQTPTYLFSNYKCYAFSFH